MNHIEVPTSDDTERSLTEGFWAGDTGELGVNARRALLRLVQGPYLSATRSPGPWSALIADPRPVRSRLHELFLDLVIDAENGFAFVRNARTGDFEAPIAVRAEKLTFLDSAMLLVLRQMLLAGEHEGRVIVGEDEVFEQLAPFRSPDRDSADFIKRLNSSWRKMKHTLRVIHTASEGRVEISPVLRLLVDADRVRTLTETFRKVAEGSSAAEHGGDTEELESLDADGPLAGDEDDA